jgi:uncharacterized membrane protein YdbT with pleckstrin-like domain
MSYIKDNLTDNEELVMEGTLHWMVFKLPIFYLVAGIFFWFDGLGFVVRLLGLEGVSRTFGFTSLVGRIEQATGMASFVVVGTSFFIIGLIYLFFRTIRFFTTEIALTNQRVLVKVGFIRRDAVELLLSKVEATMIKQTMLGRAFDYGTVSFIGTGGTGGTFSNINQPIEFHKQVQMQITQKDRKRHEPLIQPPGSTPKLDFEH